MKKILLFDDNLDFAQVFEDVLIYEKFEVKSTQQSEGFYLWSKVTNPIS